MSHHHHTHAGGEIAFAIIAGGLLVLIAVMLTQGICGARRR